MLRRAAGLLRAHAAARAAWAQPPLAQQRDAALLLRAVGSTAHSEAAAAAAPAAASVKAPNVKEFKIYRWNPDASEKPYMQSYKVRRGPAARLSGRAGGALDVS